MSDLNKYEDIINLPHKQSEKRQHMTLSERAAQFSPFAALTGFDDAIEETGRLTEDWLEHGESGLYFLNLALRRAIDEAGNDKSVSICYFEPDSKKSGGQYLTVAGSIKRFDEYERLIILSDGRKIPVDNIMSLENIGEEI